MAEARGWTVEEIYRAIDAWRQLHKRQPSSTITLEQYLDKMQADGLRPDMIGLRRGQYSLARKGDLGGYHLDNCRFIPIEQNISERAEGYQKTPEFKALMSKIALSRDRHACPHCGTKAIRQLLSRWHGDRCKYKPAA